MKQFTIIIKVILIILCALLLAYIFSRELYFTSIMLVFIIIGLGVSLYFDQQRTFKRMEYMIANIHHGDLNLSFSGTTHGMEGKLTRSMNEALAAFRTRLYNTVVAETENEAWQKLIRVLTHEIMNSIAPIISLSETLTERAATEGMNEKSYEVMVKSMETIQRRSKRLLEFVENYRKLTRIPTPSQSFFPVKSLFNDIERLLPGNEYSVSFHVQPAELQLCADRGMIEQVLLNLIKNAGEARKPEEKSEITVQAIKREGRPVLEVSDNGQGILPEVLDRIFVPFFTTKSTGSGIGLSLCRQIMNRHGGSITATSEPEKGTTFTLLFPHARNNV